MTREEFAARITAMEGTLYRISATVLRRQCDREDAVQSAILTAWRKQNSLRDESKFEAWVIRILMNACYAMVKKKKREVSLGGAAIHCGAAGQQCGSVLLFYEFARQIPHGHGAVLCGRVRHYADRRNFAHPSVDGQVAPGARARAHAPGV